jgi:hypothetical protein
MKNREELKAHPQSKTCRATTQSYINIMPYYMELAEGASPYNTALY